MSSGTGLVIGLVLGVVLLALIITTAISFLYRRRLNGHTNPTAIPLQDLPATQPQLQQPQNAVLPHGSDNARRSAPDAFVSPALTRSDAPTANIPQYSRLSAPRHSLVTFEEMVLSGGRIDDGEAGTRAHHRRDGGVYL